MVRPADLAVSAACYRVGFGYEEIDMQRRVTVFGALTIAALATATGIAGAQTVPFGGGPLARGSVVSISGSTIDLKSTNPQDGSQNDVTVTVSGSTAYRKIQTTGATSIASGDCVRVAGSGTVAKGRIKASTISITGTSAADCRRGFGGNGLGLPTTRRIVEMHGGRIAVQSEPGKGTQFTIWLPSV